MGTSDCIRVWTRYSVPERYQKFATHYDSDESKDTVFVAHVPVAVLSDPLTEQCIRVFGPEGYFWFEGRGLFGCNCMDSFPDPDGDGIIVVGGGI